MSGGARRVTAVLACHGRVAVTLEALAGLFAQALPAGLSLDVVVVDDASPDGTAEAVAERFPQVRLLHGDGGLWWAGAMALGLGEAARSAPDFLLWLNDDVRLDGGAVAALVACHDAWRTNGGGAPVVVGATRDPETGRLSYGGQRRHPRRPFRFLPVEPADFAQPCDTFQGNIVLVPRAVHERLGGISRAFVGVQGTADTDFGLRAGQSGVPVVQAPGTLGTCAPNRAMPPWSDGARPLRDRLAALVGPRGFPPRGWLTFARRHGGPLWPVWAASPYLSRAWTALTAGSAASRFPPARPRVALMDGVIAHYRLPFLHQLARAEGWAISVFHGPGPANFGAVMTTEPLPLPTVPVRHRSWPGGRRIAWTGGVMEALSGRYDAVIAAFHVHDLGVWTLWLARRLTGRPRLVLSGHFRLDGAETGLVAALRRRLRVVMARGADAVLPYTPRFAAQCVAHGVAADRVFVTHNTIDVAAVRAAGAAVSGDEVAAARRRHGLPDGPVFLFIGRLYAAKRVDLAIRAVAALRRRGRACSLLVVGDGPHRPRIESLAAGEDGVRLAPALFDEAQLAPLFRLATAVVCPDSVGLLIAHAFAYGVPLVTCRDAPGHGVEIDYLRHGENGLLADSLDADALAASLETLLDRPDLVEHLREGARRTADGLTIEAVVAANLAALRRALGTDAHALAPASTPASKGPSQ
ncbi:MAG TPA: glycosyltransferase [Azospirillum sp.]